jgi:amino-acid N-acetyltransferase
MSDDSVVIRNARTTDVSAIVRLIEPYAEQRILLAKERVTLYEDVQEFRVAVARGEDGAERLIGCGAVHVMWEDLAEIRTVAVATEWRGRGVGAQLLEALIAEARELGVTRLFCLTFETEFFGRFGFREVVGSPVEPPVFAELLRSMDEGVAEFLDLAHVKPNTLGNHRMICEL